MTHHPLELRVKSGAAGRSDIVVSGAVGLDGGALVESSVAEGDVVAEDEVDGPC